MNVTIRPWGKSDLTAIQGITWQSWVSTYSSFIPESDLKSYFDIHYSEQSLLNMFDHPLMQGYIAESEGRITGFIRLVFNQDENRIYFPSLHIIREFQGQGMGTKLIEAAEGYATNKGLKELWVGVIVRNRKAFPFYRKIGFIFVKEEPFTMGKTTVSHLIGLKKIGMSPPLSQKAWVAFDRSKNLSRLCLDLLSAQKKTWQDLQKGYELLKQIQERTLSCSGFSVRLQYNPGRIRSSMAEVSREKIDERPCFLCLGHLPESQKGILYKNDFLILCNPMPVFHSHFTISHLDHRHQAIAEHIGAFLQLAADHGKGWIVLYNGPRCGASAPDHLHFQIAPSGQMPIEREILEKKRLLLVKQVEGVLLYRIRDLGREVILLEGEESSAVESAFKKYLNGLKKVLKIDIEPMINIIGLYQGTKFHLLIFPRQKHRPEAFFKTGEEKMVVSPGVIDMGGLLITPMERDFKRLNQSVVESIYKEVSLEGIMVEKALVAMG
ncbi:MAG: GNAT family N-acetyltransferase [Deltaproteobacteria bacterium]|nr:GNAT family N-acetyltransferase [Deltaproteobacteria bacterium]